MHGASATAKAAVAAAFLAILTGAWIAAAAHLPPYMLPPPDRVLRAAGRFFASQRQLGHLWATLFNVGASIGVAFALGSLLALLAHYLKPSAPAIHGRLSPFLNAFPGIGWTLLAVIWFGVSTASVVFAITVVLLPFALVNLREGLASLDREIDEMARSFGRKRARLFFAVVLPALAPFAAATLRIMFGVAWKVTLTAELFGGSEGLGYLINIARQEYDTETIFTVVLMIVFAVYLADRFLFAPVERATARQFGRERRR
jgi:NitT/TauT family transport system permease protein/sulfonate transport system permease protein